MDVRTVKVAMILVAGLAASAGVAAMYMLPEIENVPVERLVTNLERQVAERPSDVVARVNLARLHAMAFAEKSRTLPRAVFGRGRAREQEMVPWLGSGVPEHYQFTVRTTEDAKALAVARQHLDKAIATYREVIALAPGNLIAKLGLGWSLLQTGDRSGATATLRDVIAQSWAQEQYGAKTHMGRRSVTEEAAVYLLPLLDPERDREEIQTLRARVATLERQMRAITPIAVPLADGLTALDIADPRASIAFDADGSALPQRWTWMQSNAAWLVFDRRGTRSITSGLQLFGSVTFWLFWDNGYQALAALDDDGNGRIAGAELAGLALWHDRNANGKSELGEVRPVADWRIVSLSFAYEHDATHPDEIAYAPRGVTFADGTTRPTFDLILRRR